MAKSAIEQALIAMHSSAFKYGDHHLEKDWYDYEEEVEEPKPPFERYLGIKVVRRHGINLSMLDAEFDTESSLKL